MQVDVVIAFYKHHDFAPFVMKGLKANAEYINHIYLVNDALWEESHIPEAFLEASKAGHLTLLEHPHTGFGLCRSLNAGAERVTSAFVLFCEGDEVMPPGMIAKNLPSAIGKGPRLLCCPKAYMEDPRETLSSEGELVPIVGEPEHRHREYQTLMQTRDRWKL